MLQSNVISLQEVRRLRAKSVRRRWYASLAHKVAEWPSLWFLGAVIATGVFWWGFFAAIAYMRAV